jgi:hypothetical protein
MEAAHIWDVESIDAESSSLFYPTYGVVAELGRYAASVGLKIRST